MTVDQASTFLAGSLLTMIGLVIVVGGVVVINNIIHKYWKPVQFFKFLEYPPQFQQEPHLDVQKETSKKV